MRPTVGSGVRNTTSVRCGILKSKPKTGVIMTDFSTISHFAGLAMQALISTKNLSGNWDNEELAEIAKFSYAMACAMVDQRNELSKGGVI